MDDTNIDNAIIFEECFQRFLNSARELRDNWKNDEIKKYPKLANT